MDNREERKTLGKLTASEGSSVTASCRPCSLVGTPAAFSSSEVVRSATPSTWYAPFCSSSLSSVGDYSHSPADVMDFYKSQIEPCSSCNSSPKDPLSVTVPTQSDDVSNSTPSSKSGSEKRKLSTSWRTPDPKQAKVTLVDKAAKDSQHSNKPGTQECYDKNPPPLNFKVPKLSDLPKTWIKGSDVKLPVDFLVLTVEDCEFLGFFSYLEKPFKSYLRELGCVYFGFMGNGSEKLKVALMKSSKGAATPGGSLTVAIDAVRVLRPKAVFLVGTCSGLDRGKVKLGDVVVSSKLTTAVYKTPASRDVSNLIRHAADGWQAPLQNPDALEVKVHRASDMLSRPEGVGEDFNQRCPEAIAVEMGGEGVFAAAYDLKTEWVVVKGIKDYADDSRSLTADNWEDFASVMAASVVANILSEPAVFEEWPNYRGKTSTFKQSNRSLGAKLKVTKKQHAIECEDLLRLKESTVISPTTPQGLLYNVWLHVNLYFRPSGRKWQRKLTKSSFRFLQDENRIWYATMAQDESSEKRQRGLDTRTKYNKLGRIYQTDNPNDGFNALRLYCSKLHPVCEAFFQKPKGSWKGPEESVWFENRCLGENKLGSMMKELSKAANLSHVYADRCVRATAITLWSDAGLSNRCSQA